MGERNAAPQDGHPAGDDHGEHDDASTADHRGRIGAKKAVRESPWTTRVALALVLALFGAACDNFFLSATGLEVSPIAAQPGEEVFFVFELVLVPAQSFTVLGFVDGEQRAQETRNEAYDGPFVLSVGDASDLIAAYGTGAHVAHVEVRLNETDGSARIRNAEYLLKRRWVRERELLPRMTHENTASQWLSVGR